MVQILLFLSFIISVFCIWEIEKFSFPLWLLCLSYTAFLYIIKKVRFNIFSDSPGMTAIFISMFGRYVIVPFVYYYTGATSFFAVNYHYMSSAVFLMLYEQLVVFVGIFYCLRKNRKKISPCLCYLKLKYGRVFLWGALITVLLIAVFFKSLGAGMEVMQSGELNEFSNIDNSVSDGLGYINIIWQTLCLWIYIYMVMQQRTLFLKNGKMIHVNLSIAFTFFLIILSFIDQTSLSRWYTIVMAASSLAFLCSLFHNYKSKITLTLLVPAVVLMVFTTMVKNLGYEAGGDLDSSIVEAVISTLFDSYFAGITNVNTSIDLFLKQNMGLSTLFNDVFHNMPIVNHFLDSSQTSVYQFNDHLGRITQINEIGDQIIPLLGQSLIYFGVIFAPLLSLISVLLVSYFDKKFKYSFSYLKFCYGMTAIWFGVEAMMLNMTINFSWLFIRIIPLAFVLFVTNRTSIIKRVHLSI